MKRIHIIKNIALLGLFAITATSCEDWLTLYPQDRVVEENFWEDKNDLEGVRYSAYSQLISTLQQLIIWGDIRSDSYQLNSAFTYGSDNDGRAAKERHDIYKKVVEAQLDSTMSIYDWGGVYTTINFCNKVLQHGPEVLERDPQFTTLEWQEIRAEITALRAFNYFYLIRSFKDIPYTTQVINTDKEVKDFPLSNGLEVLDSLIADVRSVAGQGRNRFEGINGTLDTHGLMTNTSIYALLAEMYLWRSALREGRSTAKVIATETEEGEEAVAVGFTDEQIKSDCDSVIYYGQLSLDALARQNNMTTGANYGTSLGRTKDYKAGINNAELIANEDMTSEYKSNSSPNVISYALIFDVGNSRESMFEIQYSASDQRKNKLGDHFWSVNNNNGSHFSVGGDAIINNVYANNQTKMNEDSRTWYSCSQRIASDPKPLTGYYNFKWTNSMFLNSNKTISTVIAPSEYNNWIFYRQTDVMLMIAEAYAVRGAKEDLEACKKIVDAIHKRSTVDEVNAEGSISTRDNAIKLVMAERQIELLGEGKRWFDLVRYAERIGGGNNPDPREPQYYDGTAGVKQMVKDYLVKSYSSLENALINRIKNRYGLYSPIYYMELKASNEQLQQNPVWNREK